jgi:hypothetical protein
MVFQVKKSVDLKNVQASLKKICKKIENKEYLTGQIKDLLWERDFYYDSGIIEEKTTKIKISDFDNTQPIFFNKKFSMGNKVIVRSNINKKLLSY